MKVIDNFLSPYYFKSLQNVLMGGDFPWYYTVSQYSKDNKLVTAKPDFGYQFTAAFFRDGIRYNHYPLIEPCLRELGVYELYRIKANLNTGTVFHRHTGWHYDIENVTTAVFYINSNNGYTKFKKGGKVRSVENRMVIFDSNLEHAGFTCTDENVRVVLNFNYTTYPKPRIIK